MQTLAEWMTDHNFNCVASSAYAELYDNVVDAYDRTDSIEYMLIGLWEHAMDGLWDGGRDYLLAWVDDVRTAYPDRCAPDGWPVGSIPENSGRFEFFNTLREFAASIVATETDTRLRVIVSRDLCDRIRAAIPTNPMTNAA